MDATYENLNKECVLAIQNLLKKPLTSADVCNISEAISFLCQTDASLKKEKKLKT